jgi:endonuclease YncB( thermonuclease family)
MRKFKKRRTRLIVFGLFLLVILVVVATKTDWLNKSAKIAQQSQPGLYAVTKFDDGDTIVVDMNGVNETVRFIGVDTPETHDPRKPVMCYGQEASDYTKKLIGNNRVRLQSDSLDTNRDRYNRLLRYIYLPDGTLVNAKLISEGYGLDYPFFPFEKAQEFQNYEMLAKKANRGLWSACQVITESSGGRHTNPVTSN